jgi:hypothetical protein
MVNQVFSGQGSRSKHEKAAPPEGGAAVVYRSASEQAADSVV